MTSTNFVTHREVTIKSGMGEARVWWCRKEVPTDREFLPQHDAECANFRSVKSAQAFIDLALSLGGETKTTTLSSGTDFGFLAMKAPLDEKVEKAFVTATGKKFPPTAKERQAWEQERRDRRRFSHRRR
jgi:hypothetical protein